MALLPQSFNVADLPQSERSYDPLPEGWYSVKIVGAELKPTKSGGQMISVRYDVLGPSHAGRVVFGNINIQNANPKAEEIGRQQLGEMCRAIGLGRVDDTDQLIGGELQIKLAVRRDETYGDSNEVKGFKAGAGSVAPRPAASSFVQEVRQAAAPAKAAPPWAKK